MNEENLITQIFKRDDETGLVNGIDYKRLPSGRIDWHAMINSEHIVFNRHKEAEIEAAYGAKPDRLIYAEVIKEKTVDEKHILILLKGFIELAELRGYNNCQSKVENVTPGQGVTVSCHITWIPNIEDIDGKTSSGVADATDSNTSGFGYLAALADNRAFVRAVKRGLGISTLSYDEIATKEDADNIPTTKISPFSPQGTLKSVADTEGFVFMQVKAGACSKYRAKMEGNPESWTGYEDISPPDCMTLIQILKEPRAK
jgi:hypothetical protein